MARTPPSEDFKLDYISSLLEPVYKADPCMLNSLNDRRICRELGKTYDSLKDVCRLAIDNDAVTPSLSATLDYIRCVGGGETSQRVSESCYLTCTLL